MDSLSTKLQHKSENQSATAELLIVYDTATGI